MSKLNLTPQLVIIFDEIPPRQKEFLKHAIQYSSHDNVLSLISRKMNLNSSRGSQFKFTIMQKFIERGLDLSYQEILMFFSLYENPSQNLDELRAQYKPTFDDLPTQTKNCLKNKNINSIQELTLKTEQELLNIPNFGVRLLRDLHKFLELHGLSLKESK